MSYGVTFLRSRDVGAYSKAATAPSTGYVVTEKSDRSSFDYLPAIFFMRKPNNESNYSLCGGCTIGPVFGIGTDLTNVSAMAGLGFRWGDNVTLAAGAAIARTQRLAGQYNFGDHVSDNLSEAQLTSKTWSSTFFISLTLRSLSNPFGKSTDTGTQKSTTTPAAAK